MIVNISFAEDDLCSGNKHQQYVTEVSFKNDKTLCKNNTNVLQFRLKKNFGSAEEHLSGIRVTVANTSETISQNRLKIYSSKSHAIAFICMNESYLNNSYVEFFLSKVIVSNLDTSKVKRKTSKASNVVEKCPVMSLVNNNEIKERNSNEIRKFMVSIKPDFLDLKLKHKKETGETISKISLDFTVQPDGSIADGSVVKSVPESPLFSAKVIYLLMTKNAGSKKVLETRINYLLSL